MADKKISQLTNLTGANLADDDEFVLVDTSADETKAITYGELKKFNGIDINGGTIDGTVIGGTTPAAGNFTTGSFTGNATFGDNDKAIFGAGSDLQIYHDGANSFIKDLGTGSLFLEGQNHVYIRGAGDGSTLARFTQGAQSEIYHAGTKTLNTTATGIDVTGTVTADGLTVDGGNVLFRGGDISFYEDTGTTPKFFWDASTESLGIGTSSPTSLLDVTSTATSVYSAISGTQNISAINVVNDAGAGQTSTLYFKASGNGGTSNARGYINLIQPALNNAADFAFQLRDISGNIGEKVRITSTGNVGIGTSSPEEMLHVDGGNMKLTNTVSNDSRIYFTHTPTANRRSYIGALETDGNGNSLIFAPNANGTDASEAMRIDSSGNVGIGTSSPASKLSVSGGASGVATDIDYSGGIATGAEYSALRFTASGLGFVPAEIRGVNTNGGQNLGVMQMFTSGSERMRITSTGNVGIGTSSPDSFQSFRFLDVVGASTTQGGVFQSKTSNFSVVCQMLTTSVGGTFGTNTNHPVLFNTNNTERMRIDSSGNLLVGTTTTQGASAPVVAKGGVAIVDAGGRGVTQEIVKGATGAFSTITVTFDGTSGSSSCIVEILMTGYSGKYLDYVAGIYGAQADVIMRDNSDAGTSVALTGSAGSSWTATITSNVSHPVVKVKATVGGLATAFNNAPTITFA